MSESSDEHLSGTASTNDQAEKRYLAASRVTDCSASHKPLSKTRLWVFTNTFSRFDVERQVVKNFGPP